MTGFDLSQIINHGTTQEVLLAIIVLFLKSAVKLLHKIHAVFINIESKLENVASSNATMMRQNEKIVDKVTIIEAATVAPEILVRRTKKANGSRVASV